jgi:hypothetical protein
LRKHYGNEHGRLEYCSRYFVLFTVDLLLHLGVKNCREHFIYCDSSSSLYGLINCFRALEELERKNLEEQPELEKHARDTQFIRTKAKEYKSQVLKLEVSLYLSSLLFLYVLAV